LPKAILFLKNPAKVRILMGMTKKLKKNSYFCKVISDKWQAMPDRRLTVNIKDNFSSVLILKTNLK